MTTNGLALVTGGSRGIGAATAQLLAANGWRVVIADVLPEPIDGDGIALWENKFDVADEDNVNASVTAIEDRHGPIDGLVNAAGVFGKMHSLDRVRMEQWDREVDIDLRGTFLVARAVGLRMAQRGRGAIVNIASVAGMSSGPIHAYTAAKAGVIQITQSMAAEWGGAGVRVNAVSPGFTRTVALEAGIASGALDADRLSRHAAMRRLVEPAEVAQAVLWLMSPTASAVTGINLPVDAGLIAGVMWDVYGGLPQVKAR